MNTLLPVLILSLSFSLPLFSQSAVLSTGGDASGSGGSVAYSVGQAAYTHIDGESGRISLGVQQPDFMIMVGTEDGIQKIEAMIYPNPVSDQISLVLRDAPSEWLENNRLVLRLHDLNGKEILRKKIHDTDTSLSLEQLAESVYILTLYQGGVEVKSFKIFKSK